MFRQRRPSAQATTGAKRMSCAVRGVAAPSGLRCQPLDPHNRLQRDAARATDSWTYIERVRETQQLSRRMVESFLTSFDILVTPTMACLPPLVGSWREGADKDPRMPVVNSYPMAVFTSLFNVPTGDLDPHPP